MITHRRPTPRKPVYRCDVWCWKCQARCTFRLDTGHWACCECQFVELTFDGALAPNPWEVT